jgi:hypothetical protein
MALSASRTVPIQASHTYRFDFACSAAAAANSLVHITNDGAIGSIYVTCNSGTELGMAYGTAFSNSGSTSPSIHRLASRCAPRRA